MLNLSSPPQLLSAKITFEDDKIVIDRSEFPVSQYPEYDNAKLLEQAAAMIRRDVDSGKLVGTRYVGVSQC